MTVVEHNFGSGNANFDGSAARWCLRFILLGFWHKCVFVFGAFTGNSVVLQDGAGPNRLVHHVARDNMVGQDGCEPQHERCPHVTSFLILWSGSKRVVNFPR